MVRCEPDMKGFTSPFSHSLVTVSAAITWMNGAFTPGAQTSAVRPQLGSSEIEGQKPRPDASTSSSCSPREHRVFARLALTVVLPTPPAMEYTPITGDRLPGESG